MRCVVVGCRAGALLSVLRTYVPWRCRLSLSYAPPDLDDRGHESAVRCGGLSAVLGLRAACCACPVTALSLPVVTASCPPRPALWVYLSLSGLVRCPCVDNVPLTD